MRNLLPLLEISEFPQIRRAQLETLQVNLGYKCNLRCLHCHVNAGPTRTEMMSRSLIEMIPEVLQKQNIKILDLTGGAPEMHEDFEWLVVEVRKLGVHVIDRCNLTILCEPGYEHMAEFLAEHQVEVSASLPCYSVENVDQQRGDGVFDKSIQALQLLNQLGYGQAGSDLLLNLVYNPIGAHLPPEQNALEADYKKNLKAVFDIDFNHLLTITNVPIQRFGVTLLAKGQFEDYMNLLKENYTKANLPGVMCRSTVSVDWQGHLYDCDFNQQLQVPLNGKARVLQDLLNENLKGESIAVADHCYACTAGQGSSCGGAIA